MNCENRERCFYIKLDNILSTEPALNRYYMIKASSGPELLKKAIEHYGFSKTSQLQIWSSHIAWLSPAIRLDTLDTIPEEHEFLWLRAVTYTTHPLPEQTEVSSTSLPHTSPMYTQL